jgi:phosphatidylglycerol:prolipoprotein diacylglycerol transferase
MLHHPEFDPVAISIPAINLGNLTLGPLSVHWYGIMYLFAFLSAWLIGMYRARKPHALVTPVQVENLITYGAIGVILGGRCGYVFFYGWDKFVADPMWLFRVWEGGMSFHGGLIGVTLAMLVYAKQHRIAFISLMDFVAPLVPLGLGFGRLGNFIGQELYGRVTDGPWAMVFPHAGDPAGVGRHASQLYQAALEGLLLFVIVFWFSAKPRPRGAVAGVFLVFYASFRFLVEFVREPDYGVYSQFFSWMTRGQDLCVPMFLLGVGLIVWGYSSNRVTSPPSQTPSETLTEKN